MNRNVLKLAAIGGIWWMISRPLSAQISPTVPKARVVRIEEGPEVERADADFVILRWTTNNPGGSPVHYGVVHYGTDPASLNQAAKSPVRINQSHVTTTFRVRISGLKPRTTYYYFVESTESNSASDGIQSRVGRFSTAGGEGARAGR